MPVTNRPSNSKMETKTDRNSKFTQHRFTIQAADNRIEGNTVLGVTIATDKPVARWWGEERFIVSEESIDLQEFREIGVNLLDSHDPSLRRLGTVSNPVISDGKVRADITFSQDYEKAVEILNSVRNKERQDLSVGYERLKVLSEKMGESDSFSDTVQKLRIIEVSVVGMGADSGAGFGRSKQSDIIAADTSTDLTPETDMTKEKVTTEDKREAEVVASSPSKTELRAARAESAKIVNMARNNDVSSETIEDWIVEGISYNEACARVVERDNKKAKEVQPSRYADVELSSSKGSAPLSYKGERLSLGDCLGAVATPSRRQTDRQKYASDVSYEYRNDWGGGFRVPFAALGARTYQATSGDNAANLITNVIDKSQLKDFLFKETVTGQLGIDVRTGQTENFSVPRVKTPLTATWVGENAEIPPSDAVVETFEMRPKTIAGFATITNLARIQSPEGQSLYSEHLLKQVALGIDLAILKGDKDNNNIPTGILATDSIVTARTGNAAARKLADNLDLFSNQIRDIRKAEIGETPVFVVGDDILDFMRTRKDTQGQYLWSNNTDMTTVQGMPGSIFGSRVYRSSNMGDSTNNLTVLSGVFRHIINAFWGNSFGLAMRENDDDFRRDRMSIRLVAYTDVGIAYPQAFKAETNISL